MQNEGLAKRIVTVAVPLILLSALVAVSIWGAERAARADELETQVQSIYRRSFFELSDNVNDMQVALKKLSVAASSAQHIQLLQDVRRLSGEAAANIGSLPAPHVDTADLNRFVIQTGDYANSLTVKILGGFIPGEEDRQQLAALYETSVQIASALEQRLTEEDFPTEAVTAEGYYESAGGEGSADGANISNYPTLIYDGPFSDSTEKVEPRGLSGAWLDERAALQSAVDYLGGAILQKSGETGGNIETYDFSGTDATGRGVEISVAKRGGAVLHMMAEVRGAAEGVPDERSANAYEQAAKAYLDGRGYADMSSSYAQYYAGVALFNFAATQDGVVLYPDLVKVYVERESGAVVGVDARNYLVSHCARELPEPLLTEEDAKNAVSDILHVESVRLALIPKTPTTELLCYECTGSSRGASFVVYINALTGAEEQLFEIINNEEGEFTV